MFQGAAAKGRIAGRAFAFKKGCAPAPYEVSGRFIGDASIELAGPGPVFGKGCFEGKLSWKSPHSKLAFDFDNRGDDK